GADVNTADVIGNTPLHCASNKRFICAAKKVLSLDADHKKRNNKGTTVLNLTLVAEDQNGLEVIINLLIKRGADVNIDNANGEAPLHYASDKGLISAAEELLSPGADINIV
ncbi:hypothetical protein CAPTEDRAFT_103495, partial [Capitella teleta]